MTTGDDPVFFWAGVKKWYNPENVDKKGDTVFRQWRGFLCSCGRRQSNGPSRYFRFHGTLFFIYWPTLSPNISTPNALCYKHSPVQKSNVRTVKHICAPRPCVLSKEIEKRKSTVTVVPKMLQVVLCAQISVHAAACCCCNSRAHRTKYQVVGIVGTRIRWHTRGACFAIPVSSPSHLVGRAYSGSTYRVNVPAK